MNRALSLILVVAFLIAATGTTLAGGHVLTRKLDGSVLRDGLGFALSPAGDVDKDGCDDFIVGAPNRSNASARGYARVYSGKTGTVLYTFWGASTGDEFGSHVNAAGDVNADGYADVIVGVPRDDTADYDAGLARVFSGKDGSVLHTFLGQSYGDLLGWGVGGAGDVNADGYDDVIIGVMFTESMAANGCVKIFSGKDGKVLYTLAGLSYYDMHGSSVNGAGDVNNDGYADVVIGAPRDDTKGTDSGKAQVVSGKDGAVLYSFYGAGNEAYYGYCVNGAGDVNRDGHDDVLVGAPYDDVGGTNTGTIKLYSGKDGKVLQAWYGSATGDQLGTHVAGGGDVNNDGYPDIVAGTYYDAKMGYSCGSVRVFSGKDGSTLYTLYGQQTTGAEEFGRSACILGDVNADGLGDIVVGAPGADLSSKVSDSGRVYVWVSTPPTGTVTINSGNEGTNSPHVTLSLDYTPGAGAKDAVTDMRFRNAGDTWEAWIPVASTSSWTLAADSDGTKTVEVQFRDSVGAISAAIEDSILLDQVPPTGSLIINGDTPLTTSVSVHLYFKYADLVFDVTHVRVRNAGDSWGSWLVLEDTLAPNEDRKPWTLPAIDGIRTVQAQYRDAVGNVSETVSDSIEYLSDVVPPVITALRVNSARAYILPDEPLEFGVYSKDNLGGSGVDAFKVSFDSGRTWSDGYTFELGPVVAVDRPDMAGLIEATVVVRDRAGNDSAEETVEFFLVEPENPWIGAGAKAAGRLDEDREVDAVELGLVEGDILTVKIKGKAFGAGAGPALALDLVRSDGTRLVEGRYPEDSKKVTIRKFVVPETGRYLLIVRGEAGESVRTGTWKLTAKVKQARENKKLTGSFTGSEIAFDATEGSLVKVTLKGDGIAPDDVTMEGPDGPVAVATGGNPGSVKLTATIDAGTGTYRIRFAGPVTVSAKVTVKLPKIKGTVPE